MNKQDKEQDGTIDKQANGNKQFKGQKGQWTIRKKEKQDK